jgi:hypothetical protein
LDLDLLRNRNGEFVYEVRPGRGFRHCMPITDRGRIEIPLDPLLVVESSAETGTTRSRSGTN